MATKGETLSAGPIAENKWATRAGRERLVGVGISVILLSLLAVGQINLPVDGAIMAYKQWEGPLYWSSKTVLGFWSATANYLALSFIEGRQSVRTAVESLGMSLVTVGLSDTSIYLNYPRTPSSINPEVDHIVNPLMLVSGLALISLSRRIKF